MFEMYFWSAVPIAILMGSSAYAQSATQNGPGAVGAPSAELGEIVVTANKRSENLEQAPAAITVITSEMLADQGITDARALQEVLPATEIRQEGPVSQTFMRGVGNNVDAPYTEAAVTYNLNGIPIPRYATSSAFFDVARVETLPGPQGTLYGGSAAGGVINIETQQPAGGFAGQGSIEGGNYGLAHTTIAQDLQVSPTLGFRTALDYERHDGYQSRNFDSDDKISGRLTALWVPSDDLKVLLFADKFRDYGKSPVTVNSPLLDPNHPWAVPPYAPLTGAPVDSRLANKGYDNDVFGARVDYSFNNLTLSYLPGFVRVDDNYLTYGADFPLADRDTESQLTQELRLANASTASLNWIAGLYYAHDKVSNYEYFAGFPAFTLPHQINKSYAAFAQTTYHLTDTVRLTAGGRFSSDSKDAAGIGAGGPFVAEHSWTHIDYKLGVDADLTSKSLIYAAVQTGYLPGGYTPLPNSATYNNNVEPEKLLAFTAGMKNRLLDNLVTLNDELFYYDYRDYQVVALDLHNGLATLYNAPKSRIYGNQLDVNWRVTKNDRLNIGFVLMSAKFTDFDLPGLPNFDGFQMANAPGATLSLGGEHSIDLSTGAQVAIGVQSYYESGRWGQYDHFPGTHQDAYTRTDLSLIYRAASRHWNARLWVRNVENSVVEGATAAGGQPGPASIYLDPPRTYGLTLSRQWE